MRTRSKEREVPVAAAANKKTAVTDKINEAN